MSTSISVNISISISININQIVNVFLCQRIKLLSLAPKLDTKEGIPNILPVLNSSPKLDAIEGSLQEQGATLYIYIYICIHICEY